MSANAAGAAITRLIPIPVAPVAPVAPAVDMVQLAAWTAQAAPGEAFEYHRGFLGVDRTGAGLPMSAARRTELIRTSDHALQLAEAGIVDLVQRRLAPDTFRYLAVMRRPRMLRPLPFANPIAAAAA